MAPVAAPVIDFMRHAMSLAVVLQTGEKRGGHLSTVASVLQPQRELRLGQGVTFPSSEGHPFHTVPSAGSASYWENGIWWPISAWCQCPHTLLGGLCSVSKASWMRKPPI